MWVNFRIIDEFLIELIVSLLINITYILYLLEGTIR